MPQYDIERGIAEIVQHEKSSNAEIMSHQANTGHILVTSASGKAALIMEMKKATARVFSGSRVIAGDADEHALTRHVADGFWCMPETSDSNIDALLNGCKNHGIGIIYPTRDGELLFWSENKALFLKHHIRVLVPPVESLHRCLDKLLFSRFGQEKGLPVIPAASHPDGLETDCFVVKERYGAGARKIGLALDKPAALRHAAQLQHPIFQPFISGKEASIDAWVYPDHDVKAMVLRTRDMVCNGESQVTTTFRDDKIEMQASKILADLKLQGHVVMQVLIDSHSRIHVIECNARFGGASTAAIAAGLDSLYWSLLDASGVDTREYPYTRIAGEVRQVRIPQNIFIYDTCF